MRVNADKPVTLKEVARQAGVSATTASYILNDRADEMRISPDTASRVRRVVSDLGYRPNRTAQNLRSSSTRTFGLISDHVASGHYASSILIGAGTAARRADHLLVIGESQGDPALEDQLIREMIERQVDGIAYTRLVTSRVTVPESLRGQRVVLLNCVDADGAHVAVMPDERAGGRAAATALVEAQVEGDIYVVGEDPTPEALAGPLRMAGIAERLAEDGREVAGTIACEWAVRDAHDAVHHWLMSGVRPGALICLNDRVALGTYQALATHGIDVPTDVSVVSFDGTELAGWLRPPVLSVELPYEAIGQLAIDELASAGDLTPGARWVPMPVMDGRSVRRAP